ncbi:LysR family transcriptional regulator [Billgrantia antri]|uniref:LysR family transcriptional regulator n=1 Tax=Halomonas sulfidivorans TaxID=2733488 RepID=A0ABX7WAV6_9GAMM|nr:LysR family transcriptional regulator [Halomonas sulfidivorans]QTP57483.1 LysR family transcriptional regulator [Halomonas sulfidivorans]
MYDLDELLAFDHVMRSGSMTRSARELGLVKSTLSRRIAHLERQLSQPLLRRQSNRLLPTEAGHAFHVYCRQILELAEQGRQALQELNAEVSGELHVVAHNALARSWLSARLTAFMECHPAVRLTLLTCTAPTLTADSQALTVWLGEVRGSELRQEVLGWLHRGLYGHPDYFARRGYPQHPRELVRHTWIDLLGETEQGLTLAHRGKGSDFHFHPPESRLRVDQQMLHGDALAHGHGLGLMPDWLAQARERAHPGSLVRCLPEWDAPAVPVTLLYPYGFRPRRLSALLAFLREALPDAWQPSPVPQLNPMADGRDESVAGRATQRCPSTP